MIKYKNMKTQVKNISDVKVELTISLGKEELATAEQVALTKLARDIKVGGFRKGKAPLEMVKKEIDPNALAGETAENAMSKAVAEAFMSEGIQALDRPAVEVKKYVPGEELEFTAEAEIIPKVELGDYKKLKAKKATVKVSKKEIDETIEKIRENFAEKKDVDRAAKNGDEVVIDFEGKKDGVPFEGGKSEHFPLELGSNSFIPGFEEGIVGHKTGDEFDLDLEFPADYHAADLAGAKVVFTVKVGHIHEKSLPEVNDEFVTKLGEFKTVDEFKKQIEEDLKSQKESEVTEKFKDDLVRELAEISKIPVPEILIEDQKRSIEMDMQQNLMYSGLTLEQYLERLGKTREEWLEGDVKKAAEDRVKAGLALAEVSKVEKIDATVTELDERIKQMKEQYANNKEALKQLESDEVRRDLANRMLTEKTVDLLVELNSK
ncbi:trigger factor [Candidatus Saccharibacteria bacterium]|jgi:trigger factor|nr:trigger factor [Candidatus Saccharibacteria bacterium]